MVCMPQVHRYRDCTGVLDVFQHDLEARAYPGLKEGGAKLSACVRARSGRKSFGVTSTFGHVSMYRQGMDVCV